MKTLRIILRPLAMLAFLLAVAGCTISYKLNGAAIDYNVYKTIYVSQFPIRAALVYPPLQQTCGQWIRAVIYSLRARSRGIRFRLRP